MKKKIIVSNYKGETMSGEFQISGKDHLKAQQKFKSTKTKNKTTYSRKSKHKKSYDKFEELE